MNTTSNFNIFIGVDQTGAVTHGKPNKLPVAVVIRKKNEPLHLIHKDLNAKALFIPSFKKDSFDQLLSSLDINAAQKSIFIAVDCVLGLSRALVKNKNPLLFLHHHFKCASLETAFGLKAGEQFFKKIFSQSNIQAEETLRKQEFTMQGQSVFKSTPYQRNVQTGTYRIWKELGEHQEYTNFNFWPYQTHSKNPGYFACEAYPSYSKKKITTDFDQSILFKSNDHKDAAIIAWHAASQELRPPKDCTEGFILS